MKTATIRFCECEHDGDLDNYLDDLRSAGAKVIGSSVDPEEEMGTVSVEFEDEQTFMKAWHKTESCGFSTFFDPMYKE